MYNRSTNVAKAAHLRRDETFTIRSREPMVIVPLSAWRQAEELLEDQEALSSPGYRRRIQRARREVVKQVGRQLPSRWLLGVPEVSQ